MKTISIYLDPSMNTEVCLRCIQQLVKKGFTVETFYRSAYCQTIKDEIDAQNFFNTLTAKE
jgi:hypothetical protein